MIKNLKKWTKPQKIKSTILFPLSKSFIITEPLGKILIISPWNYPFNLTIMPLIGAIAAGNKVILKPSEISTHTTKILQKIIKDNFNKKYIEIISGGPKETQKILNQKFDYIFFTGSENIGKIIMRKASKNLTPITLELGGKSPCIIDKETNLEKTASRIVYGKFLNTGQTCIAPDYLLINKEIKEKLIQKIIEKIEQLYTKNPEQSKDYGKIINKNHYERLSNYTKDKNTKIIYQTSKNNKKNLYFSPTLIEINIKNKKSKITQEEIFGPILPIIEYNNLNQAIKYINNKPKPLALYIFSNSQTTQKKILNQTSSGTVCINDTIIQLANPHLPFGGVGNSGFGKYHGKSSFDTFSNKKSIMQNTTLFEIPKRYPPYNKLSLKLIKKIL